MSGHAVSLRLIFSSRYRATLNSMWSASGGGGGRERERVNEKEFVCVEGSILKSWTHSYEQTPG